MRFFVFLTLLFFSSFISAASCSQDFVTDGTSTERTLMRVCYEFAPYAKLDGRQNRKMIVFFVYPVNRDYARFKSKVRIVVNGNDQSRCVVARRGWFRRDAFYRLYENECQYGASQEITFNTSRYDRGNRPALFFFSLDTSHATSDIKISFEMAGNTMLNQITYYEKPINIMDSCSITVYGETGGMIFIDEPITGNQYINYYNTQGKHRSRTMHAYERPLSPSSFQSRPFSTAAKRRSLSARNITDLFCSIAISVPKR